jgi:uncharacterized protein (TIGR03437 family)
MSIRRLSLAFAAMLCTGFAFGQQYTIGTFAGNSGAGYAGDGGSATAAQMTSPNNIAIDSSGNVYIADTGNNVVRKVSVGNISTVAGNNTSGYSGDGGPATSAALSRPAGVAVDSSGNLYIADAANSVIRKVSTSGTITTVAGNYSFGPGYAGDGGAATSANLYNPVAVALDAAGNLYISDSNNNLIRKVTMSTGIITSYVGANATANRLKSPVGIAFDSSGALYIADTGNKRIAKYAAGSLTNFAGIQTNGFSGDNGQAILAQLNNPAGVAVDSSGSVYIADTSNNRIRKVTPDGNITTIAGKGTIGYAGDGGPALSASLNFPRSVVLDKTGNIYIADTSNNVIRILQASFPVINAGGVTNAASYLPQVSPGALASIFGTGLSTTTAQAGVPLPPNLNGVSVSVNGQPAPILYITPSQINFQVPWSTAVGAANVAVSVNSGSSNQISVPVLTAGPGLFTQTNGAAIVQNSDYSLNGPSNPAAAGSTIIAYLTGSGPVNPPVADGAPTPSATLVSATSSYSATIGSMTAQVQFAGLAPFFVGLVQVNVVVPSGLATGSYPLKVTIAGDTSNAGTISVK